MNDRQLGRVRWGVRAVLTLGVAASVIANVLHARPNAISQGIAAWPPIALLITIELMAKVPVRTKTGARARILAAAGIAGIAAWVSYWHMASVAGRYGETVDAAHLLPLSVDGLVVVASVSLVELAARVRSAEQAPVSAPAILAVPAPAVVAQSVPEVAPEPVAQPDGDAQAPDPPMRIRTVVQSRQRAARSAQAEDPRKAEVLRLTAELGSVRKAVAAMNGKAPAVRTAQLWVAQARESGGAQ